MNNFVTLVSPIRSVSPTLVGKTGIYNGGMLINLQIQKLSRKFRCTLRFGILLLKQTFVENMEIPLSGFLEVIDHLWRLKKNSPDGSKLFPGARRVYLFLRALRLFDSQKYAK